jgi:ATP-dependent DNA helicase DinG
MSNKQFNHFHRTIKELTYRKQEIELNPELWIVCPTNPNEKYRNITFKPLHIRDYAEKYLLKSADVRIFMSGSFIDPQQFCKDLGILPEEVYYRKAESKFNTKENNPIILKYAGKLSKNSKEKTLPKTIPILESIFQKHSQEKGLIHCNSQFFANYILNNIKSNRLITYTSQSKDPNEKIDAKLDEFKKSKQPKIMVSYSMNEGVDLPYDQCRFQIIFKIPFPYLGDNQIRARKQIDPNWYNVKTVQRLTQAIGRGMRAQDDYCTNYIIDKDFQILQSRKFKNILPKTITETIQRRN